MDPFASNGLPDLGQVDSFVAIHADSTASIKTGRVEVGQGTTTGLLLLVAEELDLDIDRLTFVRHDTSVTPNTGGTLGSSSMALAGPRLRSAASTARQALLELAASRLGVSAANLTVQNGVVSDGGTSVTYGELIGDRVFNVAMAALSIDPGVAPSKPVGSYKLVGVARVPRVDIPAKVAGTYVYVHNIRVPGMLHGRIVRPLGQGAYGDGTATGILSVDESSIRGIGDARVVRRGDFLGVVASREFDAIQAATALKVVYADPPAMSGSGDLWGQMRAFDDAGQAPARLQVNTGDVDAAIATAARSVSATYAYHYQGHMPIGPSCAVADVTPNGALVLANPQDAFRLRDRLGRRSSALPAQPSARPVLGGCEHVREQPVAVRHGRSGGGDVPACGRAGPPAVHALGRARLGQLQPGGARRHAGRGRRARERSSRSTTPRSRIPEMAMESVATSAARRHPARSAGDRQREHRSTPGRSTTIPNRRVSAKSLPLWDNFFKTSALRGPLGAADLLRLRAARRRACACGRDGSVRVPARKHQHGAGERRLRPVARRAHRRRAARELAAAGRRRERVERRRRARAAGSRSAASPARRPRSSPRST